MFSKPVTKKIGDCEASHPNGDGLNCEIFLASHNMWLCSAHLEQERAIDARLAESKTVMQQFKAADSQIHIVTDVLNAESVAIVALRQAIWANDEISDDQKQVTYVRMIDEHRRGLEQKLAEARALVSTIENQWKAWITNGQSEAAKLSVEHQAEFRTLRIDYVPSAPTKKVKTTQPSKGGSKKVNMDEVKKYAEKYGVDPSMMVMAIRFQHMSYEDAAKYVVEVDRKSKE